MPSLKKLGGGAPSRDAATRDVEQEAAAVGVAPTGDSAAQASPADAQQTGADPPPGGMLAISDRQIAIRAEDATRGKSHDEKNVDCDKAKISAADAERATEGGDLPLEGTLSISGGKAIIKGNWRYPDGHPESDAPPQPFKLVRDVSMRLPWDQVNQISGGQSKESRVLDGEYWGSWHGEHLVKTRQGKEKLKHCVVQESGVKLTFLSGEEKGTLRVRGNGTNVYGAFELFGTVTQNLPVDAASTYTLSLCKKYTNLSPLLASRRAGGGGKKGETRKSGKAGKKRKSMHLGAKAKGPGKANMEAAKKVASPPKSGKPSPAPAAVALLELANVGKSHEARSAGGDNKQEEKGQRNMTEAEKLFPMFTRVLMKYLEQRDPAMHDKAKAQIEECYLKNKQGDPAFRSLFSSMSPRLRSAVGEQYWKKAHDYLAHFMKEKKNEKSAKASKKQKVPAMKGKSDVKETGKDDVVVVGGSQESKPLAGGAPETNKEEEAETNLASMNVLSANPATMKKNQPEMGTGDEEVATEDGRWQRKSAELKEKDEKGNDVGSEKDGGMANDQQNETASTKENEGQKAEGGSTDTVNDKPADQEQAVQPEDNRVNVLIIKREEDESGKHRDEQGEHDTEQQNQDTDQMSEDERKPEAKDINGVTPIKQEDIETEIENEAGYGFVYFKFVYPDGCEHDEEMIELHRSNKLTFADLRCGIIDQGIDVPFGTFRFLVSAGGVTVTPKQEKNWAISKFDLMKDGDNGDGTFCSPYPIYVRESK